MLKIILKKYVKTFFPRFTLFSSFFFFLISYKSNISTICKHYESTLKKFSGASNRNDHKTKEMIERTSSSVSSGGREAEKSQLNFPSRSTNMILRRACETRPRRHIFRSTYIKIPPITGLEPSRHPPHQVSLTRTYSYTHRSLRPPVPLFLCRATSFLYNLPAGACWP